MRARAWVPEPPPAPRVMGYGRERRRFWVELGTGEAHVACLWARAGAVLERGSPRRVQWACGELMDVRAGRRLAPSSPAVAPEGVVAKACRDGPVGPDSLVAVISKSPGD